nr:bacteriocin [uncultured Chitinophaga sp.]
MKKLAQIGKILSKQELKKISGGQHGEMVYCGCKGGPEGNIYWGCGVGGDCQTPADCISEPDCSIAPPATE